MSHSKSPFSALAFGRVIGSELDLPLLPSMDVTGETDVEAHIVLREDPLAPTGAPIGGADTTTVTLYRRGEMNLLCLNGTGWIALMAENTPVISLHPDARAYDSELQQRSVSTRILGDRVVTSVVPYMPVTWGRLGIHGSLLESPVGAILLLGQSGFGKSTISQILQRDHGWTVLDDDTSMLGEDDSHVLTPMGALSRLRSEPARTLGVSVVKLPGFGGRKSAVDRTHFPANWAQEYPVVAVIQLGPRGSQWSVVPGELSLQPVSSALATGGLFSSLFSLSPDRQAAVERQFRVSAKWSSIPHYCLGYDKELHTAQATADFLARRLMAVFS